MQQQNCFVVHFFVAFCLLSATQTVLSMNQTLAQQLSKTQIAHAACVTTGRFSNFFQRCSGVIKNNPCTTLYAALVLIKSCIILYFRFGQHLLLFHYLDY